MIQAKYEILHQVNFFSDSFKKIIGDKLITDKDGNFIPSSNYNIEFNEPEFGIFNLYTLNISSDRVVFILKQDNLKIYHLKNIIQLITEMSDHYGEDDHGYVGVDTDAIEEIVNWTEIEIVSIIRIWRNALNKNCQVALHFSLEENEISLIIHNNLTD